MKRLYTVNDFLSLNTGAFVAQKHIYKTYDSDLPNRLAIMRVENLGGCRLKIDRYFTLFPKREWFPEPLPSFILLHYFDPGNTYDFTNPSLLKTLGITGEKPGEIFWELTDAEVYRHLLLETI